MMIKKTLEQEVREYSDDSFSAEGAARHFFASYNEAEIDRKQKEMAEVQHKIEIVLKKKVHDHYQLFLYVNERIGEVGNEVADVKRLIQHTQKLFNDIRSTGPDVDRGIRSSGAVESQAYLSRQQQTSSSSQNKKEDGVGKLAGWLIRAPQDLSRYIVEQQYSHAVGIVIKTRDYIAKTVHLSEAEKGQALDILKEINQKSTLLANTIKNSLLNLPNSPLWGANEQHKRLQLLIQLGKFSMAAEGFSQSQVLVIKKVLKASSESATGGGDVSVLVSELSNGFFIALSDATMCFKELFAEHYDKPAITALLLSWVQNQITSFVELLSRHLQLGTNEYAALVILQLREIPARASASASGVSSSSDLGKQFPPMRRYSNFGNSTAAISAAAASASLSVSAGASSSSSSSNTTTVASQQPFSSIRTATNSPTQMDSMQTALERRDKVEIGRGAFWFLSRSLDIVFGDAKKNTLPAACRDMVSWILVPEIDKIVHLYAEEFIKEIQNQVSQDNWNPVTPSVTSINIVAPVRFSWSAPNTATAILPLATSYDWLITALNHFIGEVCIFMRISEPAPPSNTSVPPVNPFAPIAAIVPLDTAVDEVNYSRADVCEVESAALASILRILVRFIIDMKAADVKGFTKTQLSTYLNTLEAVSMRLIPSVEVFLDRYFSSSMAASQPFELLPASSSSSSSSDVTSGNSKPILAALQNTIAQLIQDKGKALG